MRSCPVPGNRPEEGAEVTAKTIIGLVLGCGLLAACGEQDVRLPGERLDIRPVEAAAVEGSRPISLPAQTSNAEWTHRAGSASHRLSHPALSPALSLAFRSNIGEGDGRRARITADPVVAGGRVFTLDARARVAAHSNAGAPLWFRDLTPGGENGRDASGGGLAAGDGQLFVTTGFGEITALDAASGQTLWIQDLDAPGSAAPTVRGDLVYVVARDNRAWALDTANGRIRWTLNAVPSPSGFSGGAGAAVAGGVAIFPFSSGEVLAAFPEGGLRRWSTVVTGQRDGSAAATVGDIAGDPVIDGDRVYVGNVSGRVAALTLGDGERLWTATEGAVGPVWPEGDSVFLLNDLGELLRLDRNDGAVIWRTRLPGFVENRARRQKTRVAHYGPVLAGGRLIVASADGVLRQFDPVSGSLIGQSELPGGAASSPAVAGGTLYVVNGRGELLAFR